MRKLCPLLIGKSGILPVRLGIFQIDLLMRHVQVTAEDHRLLLLQFFRYARKSSSHCIRYGSRASSFWEFGVYTVTT